MLSKFTDFLIIKKIIHKYDLRMMGQAQWFK